MTALSSVFLRLFRHLPASYLADIISLLRLIRPSNPNPSGLTVHPTPKNPSTTILSSPFPLPQSRMDLVIGLVSRKSPFPLSYFLSVFGSDERFLFCRAELESACAVLLLWCPHLNQNTVPFTSPPPTSEQLRSLYPLFDDALCRSQPLVFTLNAKCDLVPIKPTRTLRISSSKRRV
jgi:hypothetical protein